MLLRNTAGVDQMGASCELQVASESSGRTVRRTPPNSIQRDVAASKLPQVFFKKRRHLDTSPLLRKHGGSGSDDGSLGSRPVHGSRLAFPCTEFHRSQHGRTQVQMLLNQSELTASLTGYEESVIQDATRRNHDYALMGTMTLIV
jgi:hypothetical protein